MGEQGTKQYPRSPPEQRRDAGIAVKTGGTHRSVPTLQMYDVRHRR